MNTMPASRGRGGAEPAAEGTSELPFILFAEDDATLRDGLQAALESEGYETRPCVDGAEALAAFAERRPDLLLLDVMMPRKSGFDVCAEVRRTDAAVPILFLTAKAGEADQVLGLGLGADDYIAKPFRIRVLLARVAAALRRAAAAPAAAGADSFAIGTARIDARRFLLDPGDGSPAQSLSARELGLLRAFASHPTSCSTRCGASTTSAARGRSTSTSCRSARSSAPRPTASRPSTAPATATRAIPAEPPSNRPSSRRREAEDMKISALHIDLNSAMRLASKGGARL